MSDARREREPQWERLRRALAGLNERAGRLVAAPKAWALGHGGVSLVAQLTGLARSTIRWDIVDPQAGGEGALAVRMRRAPAAGANP